MILNYVFRFFYKIEVQEVHTFLKHIHIFIINKYHKYSKEHIYKYI